MQHPRVVVCSIRPEILVPLRIAFADVGVMCVDVSTTDEALMAIAGADTPPAVVVDECDFDEEARDIADQVRAYDDDVPVLFLGVDGSQIDNQAAAFEAGGAGYFKLPVDVGKVVAKLSVYLGCALPEIRGATLPGFQVVGRDDLPPPPDLGNIPISSEGEPTSLFDLSRSNIDDSLDDGTFASEENVASISLGSVRDVTATGVFDNDDDVFSSSSATPAPPHDFSKSRPTRTDDDDDSDEAHDIRERVARLRKSQAAKKRGALQSDAGAFVDDEVRAGDRETLERETFDRETTQLGPDVGPTSPLFSPDSLSEVSMDTGEFLSIHSSPRDRAVDDSVDADDFEGSTEIVRAVGDDEISSVLDDIGRQDSDTGSVPLPPTIFENDATLASQDRASLPGASKTGASDSDTGGDVARGDVARGDVARGDVARGDVARDAVTEAVEEAHHGSDSYAQQQLDEDGLHSALDEAQASVERYAAERTQDGDAIDDDKTPSSAEAFPLESDARGDLVDDDDKVEERIEDILEQARKDAEEDVYSLMEKRIESDRVAREEADSIRRRQAEKDASERALEREEARAAYLVQERQRLVAEVERKAQAELERLLAEEAQHRQERQEEDRKKLEVELQEAQEQAKREDELELQQVREEAEARAQANADARLEQERAQLLADEKRAEEELEAAKRDAIDAQRERLQRLQNEKERIREVATQEAQHELESQLAAEQERGREAMALVQEDVARTAKQQEASDLEATAQIDALKIQIANEVQSRAQIELEEKIEEERTRAAELAAETRARSDSEKEQARLDFIEREELARQTAFAQSKLSEQQRLQGEIDVERKALEDKLDAFNHTLSEEAAQRATQYEQTLATAIAQAQEKARREVAMETARVIEKEQAQAQADKRRVEEEASLAVEVETKRNHEMIVSAIAEATERARQEAEEEARVILRADEERLVTEAKLRVKALEIAAQQERDRAEEQRQQAAEDAKEKQRVEVFAKLKDQQQEAIARADAESEKDLSSLQRAHVQQIAQSESAFSETLRQTEVELREKFERELREEREAHEHLRLAREEEYRRRAEADIQAMRIAHEESLRLTSEAAAREAAERVAEDEERALAVQEAEDRKGKDRVAYRAGLFVGSGSVDVSEQDLSNVGSDQWVEGEIATAAAGGTAFPDAGGAPLSPHDLPLKYVAMEPSSGSFGDGELGAILFSAHFLGVTGEILITHADGRERSLFFEEGSPVAMHSNLTSDRAEEYLLRHGLITTARYDELRAGPALSARRLCALLVTDGALKSSELFNAVRGVVAEQVLSVLEWDRGTFAFAEERSHPSDRVRLSTPFDHLIAEGLRRKFDEQRLWRVLGGPSTIIAPDDRAPRLPPLGPLEKRATELFDGTRSIEDVILESGASAMIALRAALIVVSCGAGVVAARGLGASPAADIVDERDAQTERERILDRLQLARHDDYFAFLGITDSATTYEVRGAAERVRRRFDPSLLATPALFDLRAALDEIREVANDAEAVLCDDALRASYRLHHVQ